jgi:hypothetical protein
MSYFRFLRRGQNPEVHRVLDDIEARGASPIHEAWDDAVAQERRSREAGTHYCYAAPEGMRGEIEDEFLEKYELSRHHLPTLIRYHETPPPTARLVPDDLEPKEVERLDRIVKDAIRDGITDHRLLARMIFGLRSGGAVDHETMWAVAKLLDPHAFLPNVPEMGDWRSYPDSEDPPRTQGQRDVLRLAGAVARMFGLPIERDR